MTSLLLAIIYISFISLGLPDALLGAAWPSIYPEFGIPVSYAGIISMIIAAGTIVSSLQSDRLTLRLGTGKVTAISVAVTAVALFGFSVSSSFWMLCLWAVPYGLGAGSVDAGLNYYVALHYKARHMSWLHAFWGLGTTFGPTVLALFFSQGKSWNDAYFIMGVVQSLIVLILLLSFPLWKKNEKNSLRSESHNDTRTENADTKKGVLRIKGAKLVLLSFFLYCAIESTMLNWSASFTVFAKSLTESQGAQIASFIYWGMTIGRLLTGIFNEKTGDRFMISVGLILSLTGAILLIISTSFSMIAVSIFLIGLGFARVYPSLLHQTPAIFGMDDSQKIMGYEMSSAYIGSSLTPFLFGLFTRVTGVGILPLVLLIFVGFETIVAMLKRRLYL